MWSYTAVLYLLFVVRFFALRAKKRTTDAMGSTRLPQAKRRLKARPRKSCQLRVLAHDCRQMQRHERIRELALERLDTDIAGAVTGLDDRYHILPVQLSRDI